MSSRLTISVGMPRAGSGWHYNLIHDLVVANGGQEARWIRQRYHLQGILSEVNCNIGVLSARRLLMALFPVLLGHAYAIKAHAGPKPLVRFLMKLGWARCTYIYRDPRDALLSAFEYGQRGLRQGRRNAFSHLASLDQAVEFMRPYVDISLAWLACPQVLPVRYETMLTDYAGEIDRLLAFLGLEAHQALIGEVVERYRPGKSSPDQPGLHFSKGKIGRFRQALDAEQQDRCLELFGNYLEQVGYPK
jgi:hypothetical protein